MKKNLLNVAFQGILLCWAAVYLISPAHSATELVTPTPGPLPACLTNHFTLKPGDRILILAPHPDDEILATGGIIQEALHQKCPLRVVFLTCGDNNEWSFLLYRKHPVLMPRAFQQMGRIRYQEAQQAAFQLKNPITNLIFLGYPDFGTLNMWMYHWNSAPPYQGLLIRATSVPYPFAFRPGAPFKGESIVADLEKTIRDFKPTYVYCPHPDDYNNDHQALFLFTRIALWNLPAEKQPILRHYLIHYSNWPKNRGMQSAEWLVPPKRIRNQNGWSSFDLRPTMIPLKYRALRAHLSQWEYSAHYLESFVRPNELFWTGSDTVLTPKTPPFIDAQEILSEPPDPLSVEEQAAFVGVIWDKVQQEGPQLKLSLRLSKPLTSATKVTVHLFGYSTNTPFAQMPKIHLILGATREVYADMNRPLSNSGIITHRSSGQMEITLPLSALGYPDRFLIAAKTSLGELPLDHTGWRVFILNLPR